MSALEPPFTQALPQANYLLLTALDYRTPRKANMHFIADELAKRGKTRFFSLRYSRLSRFKADPRCEIDAQANRVELVKGVECFLWKTFVHPFNTRKRGLRSLENVWFQGYRAFMHPVLKQWLTEADVIFFESGTAPIFFDAACRLNPQAKKIYIASDDLQTIQVADFVHRCFDRAAPHMSALCLPSRSLADAMPATGNKYVVPHGLDHRIADQADPNPYPTGKHAVSVGSMLFDPEFFRVAATAFPDIQFHVIGSGHDQERYPANVTVYAEMPFQETLRYIKHASFGIAPYRSNQVPRYLADTSMKLMQYEFFGVPAVCPHAAVGNSALRHGYQPGDALSIKSAIRAALSAPRTSPKRYLSWSEVTDRLIDPVSFADTHW